MSAPILADMSGFPDAKTLPDPNPAPAPAPAAPEEIAALEFLDPAAMQTDIPLDHPFRWKGVEYRSLTARRLTFGAAGLIYERFGAGAEIPLVEFFAVMVGLPATVLRAMDAIDGQRVHDACLPLLPRADQAESGSASPAATGGA